MRLAGRRIIISGAASGIGRATVELFYREGASLALLDRNSAVLTIADELSATDGPAVIARTVDVTQHKALAETVKESADALGGIDGIVSSAGIDCLKPFPEMSHDNWRDILDVNLSGPFNLCHAAVPFMQREQQGGTIVHIASGAALRPLAGRTAYCASKAGLVMFAKTLAVDLAPYSIRVNAICPGIIDTPLFRQSIDSAEDPEAELERVLDRYLIRRIGQPEDIANAALFLSCDESAHVTGSALAVDGGRTFH